MIITDENEETRQVSFSRRTLIAGFTTIILLIIISIVFFIYSILTTRDHTTMQNEYDQMLNERIAVLEILQDMQKIEQMDRSIRKVLGADLNISDQPDITDTLFGTKNLYNSEIFQSIVSYVDNIPSQAPVRGLITKGVNQPSFFRYQYHNGIDIATKKGEPILAAASGVVVFSGWASNWGNMIILYHGDDYFTLYAHNEKNFVKSWDILKRSHVIALAGSSGSASGPHLHFEIWKNGVALDPLEFFPEYKIDRLNQDSSYD
jgi:murein DD-endopeptidase MepM/ murein hydrolase activator NlpD